MATLLLAISGYLKLNYHILLIIIDETILLMVIGGYYWLLLVIILVSIGDYFINGY